jgi:hypothetical protein
MPGLSRSEVAIAFLSSLEYRDDLIVAYYETLLHRPPESSGFTGWQSSGLDTLGMRLGFESSGEFFVSG